MTTEEITQGIGRKLGARRRELRLSLAQVAQSCGVSLQQIHKYETGQSVMPAPMLWRLARRLDVPVGYFFDEFESAAAVAD